VVGGGVVHRLMKKLGVSDVAALVKFAVKHGITSID
jgi:DNA-binding NarL/FixJ family response regulator